MPPLLPRQDSSSQPGVSLSSNLIVTICIIGSVFVCVIIAGVAKMCLSSRTTDDEEQEDKFRPHSKSQIERMREVRWVNHMHAWEETRRVKAEFRDAIGSKTRRTTLKGSRQGHYSVFGGIVQWEEGKNEFTFARQQVRTSSCALGAVLSKGND